MWIVGTCEYCDNINFWNDIPSYLLKKLSFSINEFIQVNSM